YFSDSRGYFILFTEEYRSQVLTDPARSGNAIIGVAQYDDRDFFIREARDKSRKAVDPAAVCDHLAIEFCLDSESVCVIVFHRRRHHLERLRVNDLPAKQSFIPTEQIFDGRIKRARRVRLSHIEKRRVDHLAL